MNLSTNSLTSVTVANSIFDDINFLAKSNDVSYPKADKIRIINLYYYKTVSDILGSQSNWEWFDTNQTTFPIGTQTMVAGQKAYVLPPSYVKILRVEVANSDGTFTKIQQFDEMQLEHISLTEFMSTSGMPKYYREIGKYIELYPAPSAADTTLASGLKVFYQKLPTDFTTSDASSSPGFSPLFHRLLSLGAAYDYSFVNQKKWANNLKAEYEEYRANLMEYYANQNREVRPRLKTVYRSYN